MTAVTADVAPVPRRPRSRLGVAAFVLVAVAILTPLVMGIVAVVAGVRDGSFGHDPSAGGWAVLGGFVFWGVGVAFVAPLAAVGVVLAFITFFERTRRRGFGVAAFVLGVLPAIIGACLLPAAWQLIVS